MLRYKNSVLCEFGINYFYPFKGIACLLLTTPPEMRLWYLVKAHCDPFENYDISGVLAQILIIVATTPTQIEDSFVLVEKVFSEINEVHVGNSSSLKRIIDKLWFEITNHLEVNKNTSYYRVVIVLRLIYMA